MKTGSPPRRASAEKGRPTRLVSVCAMGIFSLSLCLCGSGLAADPGRLFYTPAERARLEAARVRTATPPGVADRAYRAPAAVRYDGIVTRSDGRATRWVDGRAQTGDARVHGLKPGQIRADGRVYEPYQVLRDAPPGAPAREPTP